MTWAMRRRLIILGILAAVIAGGLIAFYFTTIHQAPSCFDNKRDGNEEGIDCGGSCTYLCTESVTSPSTKFVLPLVSVPGRTDVIAYISNPNLTSAARGVHFTLELYSAANTILAKQEGTVDLPPDSTVPIFIPGAYQGTERVSRAFMTFNTMQHLWYRYQETRVLPVVGNVEYQGGAMPRVTATASNPSAKPGGPATFVATIFDEKGNAIAASRTVIAGIAPGASAPLVFTWPIAIAGTVARIEVIPVLPLPVP